VSLVCAAVAGGRDSILRFGINLCKLPGGKSKAFDVSSRKLSLKAMLFNEIPLVFQTAAGSFLCP
jgi:hypothetical protein